jgi:phosphate acyltransferase
VKIGIDIYGGDFAPEATVLGCIQAYSELAADETLVLIGNKNDIDRICQRESFDPNRFEIVHTDEFISMSEHPAKAFQSKPKSSISIGFKLLHDNVIDGFASAGSTGAMMVGAMYVIKAIPGVIRPVIAANIPNGTIHPPILLDVGINPDAKPDVLYQYGILGSIYAQCIYKLDSPSVALLNIGSEEEKGNLVSKAAFSLMKDSKDFKFVGNIEGNDLFQEGKADVIVCDGFVGNVVLKEAEAFYTLIRKRKIEDSFFESFNFENYGGTPILGVNKTAIIGHGVSNAKAIKSMALLTRDAIQSELTQKLTKAFC